MARPIAATANSHGAANCNNAKEFPNIFIAPASFIVVTRKYVNPSASANAVIVPIPNVSTIHVNVPINVVINFINRTIVGAN